MIFINENKSIDINNYLMIIYFSSTIFIVFFSTIAIQNWPSPWNRFPILFFCTIPLVGLLIFKRRNFFNNKNDRIQFSILILIFFLAVVNIILSDSVEVTLKSMLLFLMSGINVFWVSKNILDQTNRRNAYLLFCWVLFILLCFYGIYEYVTKKYVLLFSNNPIPAGSLLILLSVGPFSFLKSKFNNVNILAKLTIILGIIVILLTAKRGAVLALFGMSTIFGISMFKNKGWVILLVTIFIIGLGYLNRHKLPYNITKNYITDRNTLIRAEHYLFSYKIFLKHPFFGIGLHTPLSKYIDNYKPRLIDEKLYRKSIIKLKTLENVFLCGFVEMGSILSISYLFLIYIIIKKSFIKSKKLPDQSELFFFLIPCIGFLVQTMTFDGITYLHLNWLIHSHLGYLSNLNTDSHQVFKILPLHQT